MCVGGRYVCVSSPCMYLPPTHIYLPFLSLSLSTYIFIYIYRYIKMYCTCIYIYILVLSHELQKFSSNPISLISRGQPHGEFPPLCRVFMVFTHTHTHTHILGVGLLACGCPRSKYIMMSVYDIVLLFALYSFSCALLNLLSLSLSSLYVSLFLSFSFSFTSSENRGNEPECIRFGYTKSYFLFSDT